VPMFFHVCSFGALLASGMYRRVPALLAISALMLLVGLLLHLWPSWVRLFEARAATPVRRAGERPSGSRRPEQHGHFGWFPQCVPMMAMQNRWHQPQSTQNLSDDPAHDRAHDYILCDIAHQPQFQAARTSSFLAKR